MTSHDLSYYPYATSTNVQLLLLKITALCLDTLVILDQVGASWDIIGADYIARDAVLAKYEEPIANAMRRDTGDREFLGLCEAQSRACGKR